MSRLALCCLLGWLVGCDDGEPESTAPAPSDLESPADAASDGPPADAAPPRDAASLDAAAPDAAELDGRPPDAGPPDDSVGPDAARPDPNGHPDPLGAGPGEARAGRARAEDLPAWPSGLQTWEAGDFLLANDRVALVIEDVGQSDLYDPYGGKPVGAARVRDGALVEPMDFGELLMLTGRMTVMATAVTVENDGSDGRAAVVRAVGPLRPVPFFTSITRGLLSDEYGHIEAALEYRLEPDADHVDVFWVYEPAGEPLRVALTMHGFMYTPRVRTWSVGTGFETDGEDLTLLGHVDEDATSFAYLPREGQTLLSGISVSGYSSNFTAGYDLRADEATRIHHARLVIAGRGLDGLVQAVARLEARALRPIRGVVRDASGQPAEGVRIHATNAEGVQLTRALTDAEGAFELHVPDEADVSLRAWRRGDLVVGPVPVERDAGEVELTLAPGGWVEVQAREPGVGPVPARIQVLPVDGAALPELPAAFGEPEVVRGRLHTEFSADGHSRLRIPAGEWDVVVSRGFEYSLHRQRITVEEGQVVAVDADLSRVVATPGVQCADFHIHTHRSNDSGDDAGLKLRAAAADGLEIPARSEHEFVEPWDDRVVALGLGAFMYGMSSIELTTFEEYGHFGVIPIEPGPGPNGGAPRWQRYATLEDPDQEVERIEAPELFAQVRARPERPVIIVNHPRGGGNYFTEAGYHPETGEIDHPEMWDDEFRLVEFFKGRRSWNSELTDSVADWLGFLNRGRRVFAVGSSDSHNIYGSPVGYPRTCVLLDTDDPREVTGERVRDALAAGHATVSGGIYVDAWVGAAGPGDEAAGLGAEALVDIRVQAAPWVDVDGFDVVVDGALVAQVALTPEHADPENPTIRYLGRLPVAVAEAGSYVIVAAYGDEPLEPMIPGDKPFGVTNPVFLAR